MNMRARRTKHRESEELRLQTQVVVTECRHGRPSFGLSFVGRARYDSSALGFRPRGSSRASFSQNVVAFSFTFFHVCSGTFCPVATIFVDVNSALLHLRAVVQAGLVLLAT